MKFTDVALDEKLGQGISDAGYVSCMPVQEEVLKVGLQGADLYVQSQTGSGKTAAYLITVFQRLLTTPELKGKKALIMTPTRELAVQVEEEAKILSAHTDLKAASFYGGVGYNRQIAQLKRGVDVIIGTPGRVIDLQQSGSMDLSAVAFLVIDEADRMFDMGFYPDLRKLIKVLPPSARRQTMLFSATLNSWVKNLAWEYTTNAVEVTIEAENITVDEIDQRLFHVSSDEKMRLLCGIIQNEKPESVIVFCNTKRMSEVVAKRLRINGIETDFIIGDLPQTKRLQVVDSFKSGSLRCLVATDVAARGLDVEDLALVVNFDLPQEAENYVHRIGRTARAGKTGKAYSFCSEQDVYNLPAIERYIGNKVPVGNLSDDSFAEDKSAGMYIKIARYENDYDDEPGHRRSAGTSDRRGRGGKDNRPAKTARSSFHAGKNASGDKGKRTRRPENQCAGKPAARSSGGERDLSKLSFEERMRYYQRKYAVGADQQPDGEGRPGQAAAASGESRAGRPDRQPKRSKNRSGAPKEGAGYRGRGKSGGGTQGADKKRAASSRFQNDKRREARRNERTARGKQSPAPVAGSTPAKTGKPSKKGIGGFFKKLFGIRGK